MQSVETQRTVISEFYANNGETFQACNKIILWYNCFGSTGHSRNVDFAYLDTTTYVEVIVHSQHFFLCIFFAFQLHLCRKRLTWSNGYLEVIFHALDIFSIIFATVYVEVKIGARMGAILSASAMYMYKLRCEHLPNNNKNQLNWSTFFRLSN